MSVPLGFPVLLPWWGTFSGCSPSWVSLPPAWVSFLKIACISSCALNIVSLHVLLMLPIFSMFFLQGFTYLQTHHLTSNGCHSHFFYVLSGGVTCSSGWSFGSLWVGLFCFKATGGSCVWPRVVHGLLPHGSLLQPLPLETLPVLPSTPHFPKPCQFCQIYLLFISDQQPPYLLGCTASFCL